MDASYDDGDDYNQYYEEEEADKFSCILFVEQILGQVEGKSRQEVLYKARHLAKELGLKCRFKVSKNDSKPEIEEMELENNIPIFPLSPLSPFEPLDLTEFQPKTSNLTEFQQRKLAIFQRKNELRLQRIAKRQAIRAKIPKFNVPRYANKESVCA